MADTIELDADFAQDPHSLYDRLRTEAPVYQVMRPDGGAGLAGHPLRRRAGSAE